MSEPIESPRKEPASASHHKRGGHWVLAGMSTTSRMSDAMAQAVAFA